MEKVKQDLYIVNTKWIFVVC